jgi:hypothetical protein
VICQFTQIWNDFLFGSSFTSGDGAPITVALNNLVNTSTGVKEYNVDMAGAIIAALPTLLVYVIAGRYFVRGLTAGGPGTSSSLPAIFMYTFSFNRGQLGVGAASSMMMLATVVAVLVPLMYMESRSTRNV